MGINQWEDFEPEAEEEQTGQNTQNIDQTQSQMTQTQTQNSRLNFQRAQNNLTNNNPRPQQPNRTQSTNTTQNTTQSNLNNNGRFAINNKSENTPKKAQNNNQIRSHVNNSLNRDNSTQGRTESIPQSTQEIPMVTEKDIANKRREQSYQATLQVHEEYDDYMEIETRDAGEYGEDPFMEDYFDENPEDFDNGKEDEPGLGPDPDDEEQLTEQDLEYRIKKFKTS